MIYNWKIIILLTFRELSPVMLTSKLLSGTQTVSVSTDNIKPVPFIDRFRERN